LCLFCQKLKHKGIKTLINASSFDASQSITAAAEARGDHTLLANIRGLDLIAAEAITRNSGLLTTARGLGDEFWGI
jgi:hypothetical protein